VKKRLTAAFVQRIKPPTKGQVEYADIGFPGFVLSVSYAGTKSWKIYYRINRVPRHRTLGTHPAMSLVEARDAWRAARISVRKGIDPFFNQSASRTDTFAVVVAEWVKRDKAGNKVATILKLERIIAFDLSPAWGTRRVDSISKRDVIELLDRIADRGAPEQARVVFKQLNNFFNWCFGREIIATHPMRGVKSSQGRAGRERVLTDSEIVSIWNACAEGRFGAATRLLLLTGARREEIGQLKWGEIEGDTIKLESARTKSGKPRTIALSAPAQALLTALPRNGEYVFCVEGSNLPISGWTRGKAQIDARAKVQGWRIHDLRRTCATGLQKLGVGLQVIESVLGHRSGSRSGIVGIYQRHSFDAEARAALQVWGSHVMGLVEGCKSGRVLPFGARAAE
jgi:integrase